MSDREITWSLATQYRNGVYQGRFRFDVLQAALDAQLNIPDVLPSS